jgi:hypothetical protein
MTKKLYNNYWERKKDEIADSASELKLDGAKPKSNPVPLSVLAKGTFGDSFLMTPEEEQARLRKQHTASAIGNLGNMMNAFTNLYYVSKGAPSMQVSQPSMPDYMTFSDRVNQARQNARKEEMTRQNLAYQNALDKEKLEWQKQYQQDTIAARNARIALDRDKLNWKKQYDEGRLDIQRKKLLIEEMYKKGQIEHWEAQAYIDELNALGEKVVTTDDDGVIKTVTTKIVGGQKEAPAATTPATAPKVTSNKVNTKNESGIVWK